MNYSDTLPDDYCYAVQHFPSSSFNTQDNYNVVYNNLTPSFGSPISPAYGSHLDQTFLTTVPSRHHPSNTYQSQSQSQPRFISGYSHQQLQARHAPSHHNQPKQSNTMSNNPQYQLQSGLAIVANTQYQDASWEPVMAPSSPPEYYMEASDLERTPSGSTTDSTASNNHIVTAQHGYAEHTCPTESAISDSVPANNPPRPVCLHPHCLDASGIPQHSFSRKADVQRHTKSKHMPEFKDCPWPKCERKGENGFTRADHLKEHRRGYHGEQLMKRGVSGGEGGRGRGRR